MKYVPAAYRPALNEYLTMVGLSNYEDDVGQENTGLVNFNHNLLVKNKCFANLTGEFYTEISKYTNQYSQGLAKRENGLFNNLSDNQLDSDQQGWLWSKALEFSGNNPNLAMTLKNRALDKARLLAVLATQKKSKFSEFLSIFLPQSQNLV